MRVLRKNYSPVAQQVECAVVTRLVVGSNPTRGALEFVSYASVAQLGRASRCQREGCGFDSHHLL